MTTETEIGFKVLKMQNLTTLENITNIHKTSKSVVIRHFFSEKKSELHLKTTIIQFFIVKKTENIGQIDHISNFEIFCDILSV